MTVSVNWLLSVLCVFVCVCVCVCVCVRSNQSTRKKPHYVSDLNKLMVCILPPPPPPQLSPPSCWEVEGVEPPNKFLKKVGLTGSQFLERAKNF